MATNCTDSKGAIGGSASFLPSISLKSLKNDDTLESIGTGSASVLTYINSDDKLEKIETKEKADDTLIKPETETGPATT